jgi:hypothetical protein
MSTLTTEMIQGLLVKQDKRASCSELVKANRRLGELLKHADSIGRLIEKPDHYSTEQWEKVRTDLEWAARRLTLLVERMDELRPLTVIEDDAREEHTAHDF